MAIRRTRVVLRSMSGRRKGRSSYSINFEATGFKGDKNILVAVLKCLAVGVADLAKMSNLPLEAFVDQFGSAVIAAYVNAREK